MGIARQHGNELTFCVIPEEKDKRKERYVLIRSMMKSRRRNVGTDDEFISDDPSKMKN